MYGSTPLTAGRRHRESVKMLGSLLGWDEGQVWEFIETLPYSTIPDGWDALEVINYLIKEGVIRRG